MNNTKHCPFCDELISINAKKCKHCGEWFEEKKTITHSSGTTIIEAFSTKYEILEEIGRGGMATVYKAKQKNLNRIVALKVVPKEFTHDTEFVARFQREAQSAAKLNHNNIITIHDVGEIGGYPYIAMEYLAGGDLHQKIQKEGVLSEKETKKIILPIIDALGYAHYMGIIHRDIKSSNIMLGKKGRPVLMDFGIAKSTEGTKLTKTRGFMGTPEYSSPEQADSDQEVDFRTDIYSLGIVLYEMCTGRVPFMSDNPLSVLNDQMHKYPTNPKELNAKLTDGLVNILLKSISKQPDDRFQSCEVFAEALEKGEIQQAGKTNIKPVTKEQSDKTIKIKKKKREPKQQTSVFPKILFSLLLLAIIVIVGIIITNTQKHQEISSILQTAEKLRKQKEAEAAKAKEQLRQQQEAEAEKLRKQKEEEKLRKQLELAEAEERRLEAERRRLLEKERKKLNEEKELKNIQYELKDSLFVIEKRIKAALEKEIINLEREDISIGEVNVINLRFDGKTAYIDLIIIMQKNGIQEKYMFELVAKYENSEWNIEAEKLRKQKEAMLVCVDIDGNIYETVQIGDQVWTTTNLKVTHYRNGDAIPTHSNSEWSNLSTGAFAVYDNNESNADTYGYLYNWYAVDDSRNIAPEGWHIPTDDEWQTLVDYLGRESVAGGKLKEAGTSHWNSPNTGVTNESGFTALPGGYRHDSTGNYLYVGNRGSFWSSTEGSRSSAWRRVLTYYNSVVYRYSNNKQNGFSVRCLRD